MKYALILLFVSLNFCAFAQVKGNKNIITKTYAVSNIRFLEVSIYAQVEVDCADNEGITITADENLLDLIDLSVNDGRLILTQKEWIKASQEIQIRIGAPDLERIQNSVHVTTRVKNIKASSFNAMAILGKLVLEGEVDQLAASAEKGEIDAKALKAKIVDVSLWDRGKIQLAAPEQINGIVKNDGQVIYTSDQTKVAIDTQNGGRVRNTLDPEIENTFDTRFIEFKVKNNSSNRIQCYVKGPKPDGSYFSYGFPMYPGQMRAKNWTIGSKVFRVTNFGTKKLLVEIKATDEGGVVKLYEKN